MVNRACGVYHKFGVSSPYFMGYGTLGERPNLMADLPVDYLMNNTRLVLLRSNLLVQSRFRFPPFLALRGVLIC